MPASVGFSLMELLVVITTIALLAAVLVPTIPMIRGMALQTKCAQNLKQIGLASSAYSTDWEGSVVPTAINGAPWFSTIVTFMNDGGGNKAIRGCPTFKNPMNAWTLGYGKSEYLKQYRKVAAQNSWEFDLVGSYDSGSGLYGRVLSQAEITRTSQRILIGGGYDWYMQAGGWHTDCNRHRKQDNFVFCDLHIELLSDAEAKNGITLAK